MHESTETDGMEELPIDEPEAQLFKVAPEADVELSEDPSAISDMGGERVI